MAELLADSKNVLEATKFLSGAGHASHEPQGLLTGLPSGQKVLSAGAGAVATGDIYALKAAIGFRFLPNATFLASPAFIDRLYRLVPRASTTDPTLVNDDRTQVLGFPLVEYSAMATAITTGSDVCIAGGIAKTLTVVDRMGLSIEIIPHVFGQTRGYPLGARGIYAWWRTSSGVYSSPATAAASVYLETS